MNDELNIVGVGMPAGIGLLALCEKLQPLLGAASLLVGIAVGVSIFLYNRARTKKLNQEIEFEKDLLK